MADAAVETAAGDENDDNWLYGDSNTGITRDEGEEQTEEPKKPTEEGEAAEEDEKDEEENEENNDDSQFNDEHFADVDQEDNANGDADSQENGDSDSDDSDDVKVTIGEIKSGPQYASLNIKRGLLATGAADKTRSGTTAGGKVTLEDLEGPGSINGVPALEFNIDTIEDKAWNKPGADISDYFNYGFNEVTWIAYCERQRRMRVSEAGVGLAGTVPRPAPPDMRRPQGPPRHDEGMPPGGPVNNYQPRENTIQVMTAERREYGRPPAPEYALGPPDHYLPPPHYDAPPWGPPEQTGWTPTEIKELTPGPGPMGPPMGPPMNMGPVGPPNPHMMPPSYHSPYRPHTPVHMHERERERDRERERERDRLRERDERERRERERREEYERERERERERDRDRERSRSTKPERIREKSYRRERSRSRSRRHKSRSRSPRPRERSRDRTPERVRERSVRPKDKNKDKDKEE